MAMAVASRARIGPAAAAAVSACIRSIALAVSERRTPLRHLRPIEFP